MRARTIIVAAAQAIVATARVHVVLCVGIVLCGTQTQAAITLTAGGTTVTLGSSVSWTMKTVSHGGMSFSDYSGSGNGTVVEENPGSYVGGAHGSETVISTDLSVDGLTATIQDGATYSGGHLTFTRSTNLGQTFLLRSVMDVWPEQTVETVTLTRTASPMNVNCVYGFLGSRANRLTQYAGFDKNGVLLSTGITTDNGAFRYVTPASAVAQYDSLAGNGVVSVLTLGAEFGYIPFIWDRAEDNKLYFRFTGMEKVVPAGTSFQIQQVLRFFEASPDQWPNQAALLVNSPAPEPATLSVLALGGLAVLRKRRKPSGASSL